METPTKPINAYVIPGIIVPNTAKSIIAKVENYTGVCIMDKTRKRQVVEARQIAMYLCKKLTKLSLTQIGQKCGNKDHATVLHACKTVEAMRETNKGYMHDYGQLFSDFEITNE